jgi:hypothetical protein
MNSRLSPTCLLPTPFVIINIGAQPSASCVCIWVSPSALIGRATWRKLGLSEMKMEDPHFI